MAEQENNIEKQKSLKELENKTIAKLSEAIELNKTDKSKKAFQTKEEACALLLLAMRMGVQFDLNDPVFQIFVQKKSWRDAMGRACKKVCDKKDSIRNTLIKIIEIIPNFSASIPGIFSVDLNPGELVEKIFNTKETKEENEAYNQSLWNDFYDDLPKGGGNGPSLSHKNYNKSPSEFQNLLSLKATDGKRRNPAINPNNIRKYLSEQAVVGNKAPNITPENSSKGLLFSKDRGANNAA